MTGSKKTNLAIIGGRACGKSTIAQAVSTALDRELFILDLLIEQKAGQSIPAIIESSGWPAFRELEYAVLQDVSTSSGAVWDCGGGIVCEQDDTGEQTFSDRKAALLREHAQVVYIDVPLEVQNSRLQADHASRPALTNVSPVAELEAIMALRRPWYQQVADLRVETAGKSVEEIVQEIKAFWETAK